MKLTFAKAEHLKCNATKSPDPRAVFQALRPVFNDYVSEIQRSIGYFSSVNREAKISKVVGLGNGFKLAGLQKFLQQNLQYEVERVESFSAITTDSFKDAALFEENILSFPVCYGVALQALKQTRIRTSLLAERDHHGTDHRPQEAVGRGGGRRAALGSGRVGLRLCPRLPVGGRSPLQAGRGKNRRGRKEGQCN